MDLFLLLCPHNPPTRSAYYCCCTNILWQLFCVVFLAVSICFWMKRAIFCAKSKLALRGLIHDTCTHIQSNLLHWPAFTTQQMHRCTLCSPSSPSLSWLLLCTHTHMQRRGGEVWRGLVGAHHTHLTEAVLLAKKQLHDIWRWPL